MKYLQKINTRTRLKHQRSLTFCGFLLLTSWHSSAVAAFVVSPYPISQQIALKWSAITGATGYSVCYATQKILDINVCSSYAGGTLKTTTARTINITSLLNGKAYYFLVAATNAGNTLDLSKLVSAKPQPTVNDTGITTNQCYQVGNNTLVKCSGTAVLGLSKTQDGYIGRDSNPATNSSADGRAGFNYTKIDSKGAALLTSAKTWSCVRDNVTGLIWEVKTADGGLRDWNKNYTNYTGASSNPTDANGFVAAVNAKKLCGSTTWRLPTANELQGLVDYSLAYPAATINTTYFPNSRNALFWSSSPDKSNADFSWYTSFTYGNVGTNDRFHTYPVRLVRTAP